MGFGVGAADQCYGAAGCSILTARDEFWFIRLRRPAPLSASDRPDTTRLIYIALARVMPSVKRQLLAAAVACLGWIGAAEAQLVVRYRAPEPTVDERAVYPAALLKLVLARSGVDHRLQPVESPMMQSRSLAELAAGQSIDVFWTMTSAERERTFQAVPVPLDKGLLGWRVLLIRKADAARFAGIGSLADLGRLTAGQGHDWIDADILQTAGLPIVTAATYDGLFTMLQTRRFDYFPRSVIEVGPELRNYGWLGLEIEPHLVLHYPSALYFFVNKANRSLYAALMTGLDQARRDGSFDELFRRSFGPMIAELDLAHRRVFELANPQQPADLPLARADYWFNPAADRPAEADHAGP